MCIGHVFCSAGLVGGGWWILVVGSLIIIWISSTACGSIILCVRFGDAGFRCGIVGVCFVFGGLAAIIQTNY